ncbi:MAG: cohesin domain-containing protein, partial [Anaerovoracaceae bacterium]
MKKFLAAMLIALLLIPTTIFADVATIEISGDNLAVGETKTITITFKGEKLGRVDADLTYDPSMLSYLGGGNNTGGDTGNVVLKLAGTGEDIVFHLQFKALKEGDSSISVQPRNLYNLDEESMGTS